jgi:hypothetical protein
MTEIQTIIDQALERYHAIRKKRAWLVGFAVFAVVMGLVALLDRSYIFSGWARWSGWIIGLSFGLCSARWTAGSRKMDATALAHQIEAQAGETASVVATAIDPEVQRMARNEAVAALLVKRLDLRAIQALKAAPPTFYGRMRTPSILAACAILALAILVTLKGSKCLLRIIFPWPSLSYTTLVLLGPDKAPAEGRAFNLTARISGVAFGKVRLYRQGISEPIMEAVPDARGVAQLSVNGLSETTDFVARAGDGQSKTLRISPYLLPNIESFEIIVSPPKYTTQAVRTEKTPSLSVMRGSSLCYRVHLKSPAESLVIERSAAPRQEERIKPEDRHNLYRGANSANVGNSVGTSKGQTDPIFKPNPVDPLVWEADWLLPKVEDISYRLVTKGQNGEQVRNEEAWHLNALADTPPFVKIQSHNAAEVLKRGDEKICFKLGVVDDVKLKAARLVFRHLGKPHTCQEIKLPVNTERVWSGEEVLDLAPFGMQPLDIIAVHFEAEDNNTLDGPGIGRSEVIYLEVPPPEEVEEKKDDAAGGEGGSTLINPLALQMEILKSTIVLHKDSPASDRAAVVHDQRQNREYAGKMEIALIGKGLTEVADLVSVAGFCMGQAAETLNDETPEAAVTHMENALGKLIEASKLLKEAKSNCTKCSSGEKFTLKPPKPKKASAGKAKDKKDGKDGENGKKEELRKLMAEVQRQLNEQEKLNQGKGREPGKVDKQQALAQDAKAAAGTAKGMVPSTGQAGGLNSAAAELDKAAGLQEELADALGKGVGGEPPSTAKAAQSVEALSNALDQLTAQLGTGAYEGNVNPPGYERLVSDYLRSISNE